MAIVEPSGETERNEAPKDGTMPAGIEPIGENVEPPTA
jgi:hypothetical protein